MTKFETSHWVFGFQKNISKCSNVFNFACTSWRHCRWAIVLLFRSSWYCWLLVDSDVECTYVGCLYQWRSLCTALLHDLLCIDRLRQSIQVPANQWLLSSTSSKFLVAASFCPSAKGFICKLIEFRIKFQLVWMFTFSSAGVIFFPEAWKNANGHKLWTKQLRKKSSALSPHISCIKRQKRRPLCSDLSHKSPSTGRAAISPSGLFTEPLNFIQSRTAGI